MNLLGEVVRVEASTDPTKVGRTGKVVAETAKTLLLDAGRGTIMVEKAGAAFSVAGSPAVALGDDMIGRTEDRLAGRGR